MTKTTYRRKAYLAFDSRFITVGKLAANERLGAGCWSSHLNHRQASERATGVHWGLKLSRPASGDTLPQARPYHQPGIKYSNARNYILSYIQSYVIYIYHLTHRGLKEFFLSYLVNHPGDSGMHHLLWDPQIKILEKLAEVSRKKKKYVHMFVWDRIPVPCP